jgi:site-specific recombinase XerC
VIAHNGSYPQSQLYVYQMKGLMRIKAYLKNLASQTSSIETLRAYRQDLEKYEKFLRAKGLRVTQAKPSTIREFINHLADKNGGALAPARCLAAFQSCQPTTSFSATTRMATLPIRSRG